MADIDKLIKALQTKPSEGGLLGKPLSNTPKTKSKGARKNGKRR